MRFVVDVVPTDDGRVEGTVRRQGLGRPVPFCGWLDLLRLLEPAGSAPTSADEERDSGVADPCIGLDR